MQGTGLSTSTSFQEQERPFYYTSDFSYLPTANRQNGISGFLRNPEIRPDAEDAHWTLTAGAIDSKSPGAAAESGWLSASMPRSPDSLYLEPWTEEDWKRLGFARPFNAIAGDAQEADALGLPKRFKGLPKSDEKER